MRLSPPLLLLTALVLILAGSPVAAQQTRDDELHRFQLAPQPLNLALDAFESITGWTVIMDDSLAASATSRPLRGTYNALDALGRMLSRTGFSYELTGPRRVQLTRQPVELAAIRVVGERDAPAPEVSSAMKIETPLRNVPQTVSIVPRSVIADQQISSLADVVRFVPGVTMGQGEGHRDQPTIRGNNSTSDLFVDGVRDDAEYIRDVYNIERVEIPKGSNALIFGRGAGGGLINRVTKEAGWMPAGQLALEGGVHDSRRGSVDLGRGFGPALAGRVNAMYENSGSYRDHFELERYGITPALTLAAGSRTTIRAGYEHFNDHRTTDRGIPSFQGRPVPTDPSTFFGDPATSYSSARVNSANGILEHRASSGLTVRNHARFTSYRKYYQNVFPGAVNPAGDQVALTAYASSLDRENLFNQTDLTYLLRTGGIQHTLLAGVEIGRQVSDAYRATGYFNNTVTSMNVPVSDPTVSGVPVTFRQSASDADAHTVASVRSAYVQDQVRLGAQVLAVAGVRFERFHLDYRNNRDNATLSRTDNMLSPRVGLVIKPVEPFSVYGSYGVSFLPSSGNQFTALTVTAQTLEPEQFTNYEFGMKWDVRRGLSLALAAYRLDRTNTAAPHPTDATITIQTGSQRSEGLELSATGSITPSWQVMAGYGYQDVTITSRTTAAPEGATVPLTPAHQASLWNRYQFTRNVGGSIGLIHRSAMYAAVDGTVILPGYTRVDAGLSLDVSSRVRFQLNAENVFNTRHHTTAHNNNNITPGTPRTVRAGLDLRY